MERQVSCADSARACAIVAACLAIALPAASSAVLLPACALLLAALLLLPGLRRPAPAQATEAEGGRAEGRAA